MFANDSINDGCAWSAESPRAIERILGETTGPADAAEERLADALGGQRPAAVMVVESSSERRSNRHLTLVSAA